MRICRGILRGGALIDAIIFFVLVFLLIVFLQRQGPKISRIKISFQSEDEDSGNVERERREVDDDDDVDFEKYREMVNKVSVPNERHRPRRPSKVEQVEEVEEVQPPPPLKVRSKIQIDARSPKCRQTKYDPYALKRSTTLVVQFTDYELYDAEVTLSSVLDDVEEIDRESLADIILVDAASTLDHIRLQAKKYVDSLRSRERSSRKRKYSPPVRLIRVESEVSADESTKSGSRRPWPREIGAEAARTDVVVFVDAGVVVGRGWLAPLISPLLVKRGRNEQGNGPSAVESHLDRLHSPVSLDYRNTEEDLVPVPSWSLAVRMRRLPIAEQSENEGGVVDPPPYRPIPVLRGSAFAVRVIDLESIGGLFDEELDVEGGGEHLELSLRLWMCGGGIQQATCSRVGVPDIEDEVRIVSPTNVRRVVDTWFPTRRVLIDRFGGHRVATATSNDEDERRTRGSVALESGMCQDMDWYVKKAAMGSLLTPINVDSMQFGSLQVMSGSCAHVSYDHKIELGLCIANSVPPPDAVFELTSDGSLMSVGARLCLTVTDDLFVKTAECQVPPGQRQKWQYNAVGEIMNNWESLCATHVTDPADPRQLRQVVMAQRCHRDNDKSYEQFKNWRFLSP